MSIYTIRVEVVECGQAKVTGCLDWKKERKADEEVPFIGSSAERNATSVR